MALWFYTIVRHSDGYTQSTILTVPELQLRSMQISNHFSDRKSQSRPAGKAVAGYIEPYEGFEQSIDHPCVKARAIIIHMDQHLSREGIHTDACTVAVFDGVLDQIAQ